MVSSAAVGRGSQKKLPILIKKTTAPKKIGSFFGSQSVVFSLEWEEPIYPVLRENTTETTETTVFFEMYIPTLSRAEFLRLRSTTKALKHALSWEVAYLVKKAVVSVVSVVLTKTEGAAAAIGSPKQRPIWAD